MSTKKPTFAGEAQFAGYTDSSRGGPRITLRLSDRDELQKFVGLEGKRYMVAMVEIADDEAPAEPTTPKSKARDRLPPLCEWAVLQCEKPMFQQWCQDQWDAGRVPVTSGLRILGPAASKVEFAKLVVCALARIESRKELDTNPDAAQRFHRLVRIPYAAWLREQEAVQA